MSVDKMAAEVPNVMTASGAHLRKIAKQNVDLVRENQALASEMRVMKLARRMEERGLQPNLSYEEKVASLREVDDAKLAGLEAGVEIAAGGFNLGTLDNSETSGDKVAAIAGENYALAPGQSDPLDAFILSGSAHG